MKIFLFCYLILGQIVSLVEVYLIFSVNLGFSPCIISVKYRFILPDDGSHTIRNMSE